MRKRVIYFFLAVCLIIAISTTCYAQVRVRGYYRKDGTYVRPHVRSNSDGNPYNNWSYPGNINPYTGKVAIGNPETYLKNYWKRGGDTSNTAIPKGYVSNISAWVSANILNVRLRPSINSSVIGKLKYLDIVEVQEVNGNWAFIKYRYVNSYYQVKVLEGYAATKYLITK